MSRQGKSRRSPQHPLQEHNATVTAQSRLDHSRTIPQYHSEKLSGRLSAAVQDVARVEIGADSYQ
jgi:hypothetical protein